MEQLAASGYLTLTNIFVAVTVILSLYAFSNQKIFVDLMFNPYKINSRRQYYRFITSGFIHNDHIHLIFNMIALYYFGAGVEYNFRKTFGGDLAPVYFGALYLIGIVVADVPTYFKNQNNPGYNAVGASGGVSSVVLAFILFDPLSKITLYFFVPISGFIFAVLYIVYSWYSSRKANDNINHDAHLYGALFGIVFCVILHPAVVPEFFEQISDWKMF